MPTLLEPIQRLAILKWLGAAFCALAMVCASTATASALEPAQTKTRVWGFDFAADNSAGLFRAASSGKHQGNRLAGAEEASGSLLAAKGGGRAANKLGPDSAAEGAHSTFKRDPQTGKVAGHAEWKPNPRNPSGFDEAKRVDVTGGPHFNKATRQDVPTPHAHEKSAPGGVRPARPDEVPH